MIREAVLEDVLQINDLGELLHKNFARLFHLETEIDNPYGIVLVYVENEKIWGYLYASFSIDNIDLLSIYVDCERKRENIGSKLMNYLIKHYGNDKSITLEVDVKNEGAILFYKKYFFEVVHVRKNYYNGCDAYLMKRGV